MVFLCVALSYAVSALVFRVPVPVQPMKAMAGTVIALGLSAGVVSAAGIEIGLLMLVLAFTPLARWLARLFPKPVLRGIQLAIGLLLLKSAVTMAGKTDALPGMGATFHLGGLALTTGLLAALAIAAVLLVSGERSRVPAGLVVLGVGGAAGLVLALTGVSQLTPVAGGWAGGWDLPFTHMPSLDEAWVAFYALVLPQLPLSLGNAVFATEDVLRHYFGDGARRATAGHLCLSMGVMNVGCGLLGAMPLCHGSGGATAHYRLGARTAGATLAAAGLFGAFALAAVFGLSPLFVPGAVLAGLLLFVGVEHCLLVTDVTAIDGIVCAVVIAAVALVTSNLAYGFAAGWLVYTALKRTPLHRATLRWPALTARLAPRPAPPRLAPPPLATQRAGGRLAPRPTSVD